MEKRMIPEQYAIDIISAMAERTIRRLCAIIVLLVVLFGTAMTLWMIERSQYETFETTTEIEQDTNDGGSNYIVGGDYIGEAENQNHDEEKNP